MNIALVTEVAGIVGRIYAANGTVLGPARNACEEQGAAWEGHRIVAAALEGLGYGYMADEYRQCVIARQRRVGCYGYQWEVEQDGSPKASEEVSE